MIQISDKVQLVQNDLISLKNRRNGKPIIIGTKGIVVAARKDDDGMKYLVKYAGHGGLRHSPATHISLL